jgi:large subunit ribosomal protein L23
MKSHYEIILRPHVTEKSRAASYGEFSPQDRWKHESQLQRQYVFEVARDANKLEIKAAIEAIYNLGKRKKDEMIVVTKVRTISVKGKSRRVGFKNQGKRPDWRKAIVTLAKGQMLEDYGV